MNEDALPPDESKYYSYTFYVVAMAVPTQAAQAI
jgi:hypothetical protein